MQTLKPKPSLIKLNKNERLYELDIPVIGLTGGIACGKSTVAKLFKKSGATVIDADKLIHDIYQDQETKDLINSLAPSVLENKTINFKSLRELFFNNKKIKEEVVNFLYQKLPEFFLNELRQYPETQVIIYDVPLLFENNLETKLDCTITVYADRETQLNRVMKRDKITEELAQKILNQQMDIELKKEKADYILDNTGLPDELISKYQELTSQLFL